MKIKESYLILGKDNLVGSVHAAQSNSESKKKKSSKGITLYDHQFNAFTFKEKEI